MTKYKIGQLSKETGLTLRTIRYYDELKLLKSNEKTRGGQRIFSSSDIVYIKRIKELKSLGFTLDEIRRIIHLGSNEDDARKNALLGEYKMKLTSGIEKMKNLELHIKELKWHIDQLENVKEWFNECPGSLCESCEFKKYCTLKI